MSNMQSVVPAVPAQMKLASRRLGRRRYLFTTPQAASDAPGHGYDRRCFAGAAPLPLAGWLGELGQRCQLGLTCLGVDFLK